MSSHHIVRENQEPALLVEDYHAISSEYIGQILEWSPTIITDTVSLDYFLSQEIKVDVLYGENSSEFQEELKYIQPKTDFIQDSLAYLIDNNYKAVNVLAAERSPILLDFAQHIDIVVFVKGVRYVIVKDRYEKWKSKGQQMYIDVSCLKSFNGLKFLGEHIFEVEQDGFVTIEMSSEEFVFVGEEI